MRSGCYRRWMSSAAGDGGRNKQLWQAVRTGSDNHNNTSKQEWHKPPNVNQHHEAESSLRSWKSISLTSQEIPHLLWSPKYQCTVFTRLRLWSLPWARQIQSTASQPIYLRFILISLLSSHLLLGHVAYSLQVFRPKFCMYFSCLSWLLCSLSISYSLLRWP